MSETLTPARTLMMWSLLAQGGRALQAEIAPKMGPGDRTALAKFVTVRKHGRANAIEMTDAGWGWAAAHLGDAVPPNFSIVRDLLLRLDAHLKKHGEVLADFIGEAAPLPALPPPPERKPKAPPRPKAPSKPKRPPKPLTDKQIRNRIAKAYETATGAKSGSRALLSDLRPQLAEIDRATLDAALSRLHETDLKMQLMRLDNPREITPAVEAAKLMFKGEPMHILWIEG